MNISTGGPHILLFERDQQLSALLTSELQLAGYECHTARTAVEVFDAIARYSVRLVLVNLAQAAAARREFWVALDTQRRGSGVQVFTFHCSNLAGYGPRDADDASHNTPADIEIDGMLGLMNLVEAVRARVPGSEHTMPRMPRTSASPGMSNATVPMAAQRLSSFSTQPSGNAFSRNGQPGHDTGAFAARGYNTQSQAQVQPSATTAAPQQPPTQPAPTPPTDISGGGPGTYSEKIRAVLYPHQRAWSSTPNWQETRTTQTQQETSSVPSQTQTSDDADTPMLQRLASGLTSMQDPSESGLAQLSRLAQGYPAATPENTHAIAYQPVETRPAQGRQASSVSSEQTIPYTPMGTRTIQFSDSVTSPMMPTDPAQQAQQAPIASQPLRAAPIQDLPVDQSPVQESQRRTERPGFGGQPAGAGNTISSPLASITSAAAGSTHTPPPPSVSKNEVKENVEKIAAQLAAEMKNAQERAEAVQAPPTPKKSEEGEFDENISSHNAVILDILQSLPPIPNPTSPQQAIQAQILNGRAQRSLGSVLLDGHLVPQDRLAVAQNIQRMLRGVDLDYQLGDILLMFKLLTPDQLLAASLVSYGLLTTTQISALGRIRQELHSIGLEYDLENLLILFRILTPEQIREVRSSVQN